MVDLGLGELDGRPGNVLVILPRAGLEQGQVGLSLLELLTGNIGGQHALAIILISDSARTDQTARPFGQVVLELDVGQGDIDLGLTRRDLFRAGLLFQFLQLSHGRSQGRLVIF